MTLRGSWVERRTAAPSLEAFLPPSQEILGNQTPFEEDSLSPGPDVRSSQRSPWDKLLDFGLPPASDPGSGPLPGH